MACSLELDDSIRSDIGKAYAGLCEDPGFIEAVTYNTSDTSVVNQRFGQVLSAFAS